MKQKNLLLIPLILCILGVGIFLISESDHSKRDAPESVSKGVSAAVFDSNLVDADQDQLALGNSSAAGETFFEGAHAATPSKPADVLAPSGPDAQDARWPNAEVLERRSEDLSAVTRRVRTVLQPADLPYPILVEERLDIASGQLLSRQEMVANRVIVRANPGEAEDPFERMLLAAGAASYQRISEAGIYQVHFASITPDSVAQALQSLRAQNLLYAEPDYIVRVSSAANDPKYVSGELWGLHNTGQDGGVADADIDAPEAWAIRKAAPSVIVGVIDSGVLYTHEDLADNMWVNSGEIAGNGIDDDGNGYIDDIHGINAIIDSGDPKDDNSHGTHCAGTIGGVGNNGLGVAGVAWDVQIMGLKFLSSGGSGATSDAVKCVEYARLMGADITSNSWGGGSFSQSLYDAIALASDDGMLFVAAAGNASSDNDNSVNYPSNYQLSNIVAVAASTREDSLAAFSNYGFGTVHLAAPGQDILSCGIESDSDYTYKSGTSMATPQVAGALAVLKAEYPAAVAGELINRLYHGGDAFSDAPDKVQTGGRLNLYGALTTTEVTPLNDDFSEARVLPDVSSIYQTTVHGATAESSHLSDGIANGAAIWWRFTASSTGETIVDFSGTDYDTVAAVYTGTDLSNLTAVASDDDSGEGTASFISFAASAGQEYYIAVVSKTGAGGFLRMETAGAAANDNLANATSLSSSLPASVYQRTDYTTKESGEANHAGQSGGASVWFRWTSPTSQEVTVTTKPVNFLGDATTFDTLLAVYSGAASNPTHAGLSPVASNDNAPEGGTFSTLKFSAQAGVTYYLAVDGLNGATGLLRIILQATPSNDDFAQARVLSGDSVSTTAQLRGATAEVGEPAHAGVTARHTLWYEWTPDTSGSYSIDTINNGSVAASMPTLLAVYTGASLGSLSEVAADGDQSAGGLAALVGFEAVAGQTYRIAVGLDSPFLSPILSETELHIQPIVIPDNDDFVDATAFSTPAAPGSPETLAGSNTGATFEAGEPEPSSNFLSVNTVWWKWTATTDNRMQVDTLGSDFDTYLEIFTGSSVAALTRIASDDDSAGNRLSVIDWVPTIGQTYYFRVCGYSNANGSIGISLGYYQPNAYDLFATGKSIVPGFYFEPESQVAAAMEVGEPAHAGVATADRSLWFRYDATPENAGTVTFSTSGSFNDTVVAVYTGSDLSSLSEVVSNDDFAGKPQAEVTWQASAGTTYHIAVAVADPSMTSNFPEYYISFARPVNDDFSAAVALLGDQHSLWTSNFGTSKESGEPNHAGNSGGRSIWYDWTPTTTGYYELSTAGSYRIWYNGAYSAQTLDTLLAVYTGTSVDNLSLVASNDEVRPSFRADFRADHTSRLFVNATAGQTYRIAIDGYPEDGESLRGAIKLDIAPFEPPANDALSGAELLTESYNQVLTNNSGCTTESGEPTHGGSSARSQHTLWWQFVAPKTGTFYASTAGNFYDDNRADDTVVAVYSASVADPDLSDLTAVASDASDAGLYNALTSFSATEGESYYIAVGSASAGGISFIVTESPANDSVADAQRVYGSSFTATGYNVGAQDEPGEVSPDSWQQGGHSSGFRSVWWRWTAPASGDVTLETYNSDLWVLLAAYVDAASAADAAAVGEIWDEDGIDGLNFTVTGERDFEDRRWRGTVRKTFPVSAGTTYLFRVAGYGYNRDHAGTIELELTGPAAAPPTPQDFIATRFSASRVDLSWTDLSSDESSYILERSTSLSGPWSTIATLAANTTAYSDSSAPDGSVHYRLKARNAQGDSGTVVYSLAAPDAPSNLVVSAASASSLSLSWDDLANESSYRLERSADGGAHWVVLASQLAADSASYVDAPLPAETSYDYRLRASNANGVSSWSTTSGSTSPQPIYTVSFSDSSVAEGSGNLNGTVTRTGSTASTQVVQLSATDARLTLPASLTIPAGQASVAFVATVGDDALVNTEDYIAVDVSVPQATASESFDYTNGVELNGESGGYGFSGAWSNNATKVLTDSGFNYTKNGSIDGATTGSARLNSSGGAGSVRTLSTPVSSGSVWVSWLHGRNSTNWSTGFHIRSSSGDTWLKIEYANTTDYWVLDQNGTKNTLYAANPYPTVYLMVLHLDFDAGQVHAYMSPDVSGSTPLNSLGTASMAMDGGADNELGQFRMFGYSALDQFDEIRVADSFAALYGSDDYTAAGYLIVQDDEAGLTVVEQWRQDFFGQTASSGDAADAADPDGDGIVNLLEHAFGGDPLASGGGELPVSELSGNRLQLHIRPTVTAGLVFTIEANNDLTTAWTESVDITSLLQPGQETIYQDSAQISEQGQRFLRLKITRN